LTGTERERLRRCFSNVIVDPAFQSESAPPSGMTPFRYQFIRASGSSHGASTSFLDSQIKIGDPVVISSEEGHFGLAIGYVHAVTEAHVICNIDRPLNGLPTHMKNYDDMKNQDFVSYIEAFKERSDTQSASCRPVYRIDLDEFSSRMGMARDNIVSLVSSPANERLRKLVVDLEAPFFSTQPSQIQEPSNLNPDQRSAIDKVMSGKRPPFCFLILTYE
jgi:DNA replication ATP-dependent helicase Dna2